MTKWDLSQVCKEWFDMRKSYSVRCHVNRMKGEDHITTWVDAERALDKIQLHFIIKGSQKVSLGETFLSMAKRPHKECHRLCHIQSQVS